MKNINLFRCLVISIIIFVNSDCKKVVEPRTDRIRTDTITTPTGAPPQPPQQPSPQSPPGTISLHAGAGPDHLVFLPTSYCTMYGWVSGPTSFAVLWSKISGPTSCFIETPNSLGTKVSNLVNGVYQFEMTVSANGLMGKDTCTVTVGAISTNPSEIIFENQNWGAEGLNGSLLWGSAIVIRDIHKFIPSGIVFKTYIRRDSTAIWEELIQDYDNSSYILSIMNDSLGVWSSYEETDTPDIKLVY